VLLSVSNDRLIPAEQLEQFSLAVNFHDGPLPAYSGSNVTAWALMARERAHAITWHRMTAHADAGDILLQVPVPIAFDESALTLNGKCHAAALASFGALVDAILEGDVAGRPQHMAARVFYPRERRAPREGVLDFRHQAADLDAMVRALDWGEFVNPLGLPKIWLGDGFVVVRRLAVRAARSRHEPGTVVEIGDDALTISTSSHDVAIAGFLTLDGQAVSAAAVCDRFRLRVGCVIAQEGHALDGALLQAAKCRRQDETYWMARWRNLQPVVLPQQPLAGAQACETGIRARGDEHAIFSRLAHWLGRLSGMSRFDLGLCDNDAGTGTLVAGVRPLRVDAHEDTASSLAQWREQGPLLRDAVQRYPGVVPPRGWTHCADWPVVVQLAGVGAAPRPSPWPLRITIDTLRQECRLACREGAFDPAAFHAMVVSLTSELG
jgi:methionyl-tRNA formyltransferase